MATGSNRASAAKSQEGSDSVLVGVDTGGTFTDVVVSNGDGTVAAYKSLTTAPDPSVGVLSGIHKAGVTGESIESISHGTTIGVNTIITRTGAKVALLHTDGFRDLLDMGRAWRPVDATVDPRYRRPHEEDPIVRRFLRRSVKERILADGTVLFPLEGPALDDLRKELQELVDDGVESVAICFLHSYKYPEHEQRVKEFIESEFPQLTVDISSEICPYPKEYGRTMTTVLNAYIRPVAERYAKSLHNRLEEDGYTKPLWMATNQGGMTSAVESSAKPVLTLGSGPVGGVLAAKRYSELFNLPNIITLDIGGTSADVSIITDGQIVLARELTFEHDIITTLPVIEVNSIGAGGSSIASLDVAGGVHVGPASAGGDPGPASYGRGGEEPTVTDAWLLQNMLSPDHALGGEINLRRDLAEQAMSKISTPLGMEPEQAAQIVSKVANSNMAELVRRTTVYRGLDPRDYTLLGFGAAGPVAASAIAADLQVGQVLVPRLAGDFSAYGLAQADFTCEHAQPVMGLLDDIDESTLRDTFAELSERCYQTIEAHDMSREDAVLALSFDGMYLGQSWELTAPIGELPKSGLKESLAEAFHNSHELLRGYKIEEMGIRLLTVRAIGYGQRPRAGLPQAEGGDSKPPEDALLGNRDVDFGEGPVSAACYQLERMKSGNELSGPAILHEQNYTVAVGPTDSCRLDAHGNCWISLR